MHGKWFPMVLLCFYKGNIIDIQITQIVEFNSSVFIRFTTVESHQEDNYKIEKEQ